MTEVVPAVRRFWWVLVVGVLAAVAGAVAVAGTASPVYSTVAELLVTSNEAPYYRINVETSAEPRDRATGGARASAARTSAAPTSLSPPDINTLVRAANLYPFLIQSDLVANERRRLFGEVSGTVTARAIFAVSGINRFESSEIPIIQVIGEGSTPREATRITQSTSEAFISWINGTQDAARLTSRDRVVIQQIRRPNEVVMSGGTPTSLVLLVVAAILGAAGLLAVVLNRSFPGASATAASPEQVASESDATAASAPGAADARSG